MITANVPIPIGNYFLIQRHKNNGRKQKKKQISYKSVLTIAVPIKLTHVNLSLLWNGKR